MSKRRLAELRSRLQHFMAENRRGYGISTAYIVAEFRKRHGPLVSGVTRQLEDIALAKLVGDAARRRARNTGASQGDLFPGFPGIRQSIQISSGEWRDIRDTTIQQFGLWLSDKSGSRGSRREREPGAARLLKELQAAGAKPNMTVAEAWALLSRGDH